MFQFIGLIYQMIEWIFNGIFRIIGCMSVIVTYIITITSLIILTIILYEKILLDLFILSLIFLIRILYIILCVAWYALAICLYLLVVLVKEIFQL